MAFDNTKYHVELNSVPYQVKGYQRSELSTFIPRLSSGDQKEYDFDLLRSKTIRGFNGGILQRYWEDDTSVFATEGMYPKFDDGTLYPINSPVTSSSNRPLGSTKAWQSCYVVTDDYAFVAGRTFAGANFINRINADGTITAITIPAGLSGASDIITSMVVFQGQLWVFCAALTSAIYFMTISATSLTAITGGSGNITNAVVYKGSIYGTSGAYANRILYRYTGDTTTRTFVQVGNTGQSDIDYNSKLFVYNNRILLTRADGMYAYDGVQLVAIEDASQNINDKNYRYPAVCRGYLYYFMPDGWYRFNGSQIEKLYDNSEIGFPKDVIIGKNRIWMLFTNSSVFSSRYDKSMGYDYSSGTNVDGRVVVFNGKGLYTYARTSTLVKNPGSDDVADQGAIHKAIWFKDKLFITNYIEKTVGNEYITIDTDEIAATGNKAWRMVTSIFDGEFPMIDKNFENTELFFDGNVSADQTITIEYRTLGFDGSTSWTTLGTISTQTELKRYVWKSIPAGINFDQIQFRLSGTTATGYGIAKATFRFTLSPDYKNQWTFTALCYGDEPLAPLMQVDDTESSQAVHTLRGNIYTARNSNIPVKFIDCDQLDLNEALDNSETGVDLNSTALIKGDDGFIQIDDEIMYWYAKTSTTLTVIRGVLGSSAATHSDNAKVFIVYRVIIRQITNERIEFDKPENTAEDKSRASEITLTLQEV